MKKYELTILFPSSNSKTPFSYQYKSGIVYADEVETVHNSLHFREKGMLVAMYPANYTIIESINEQD